MEGKKCFMRTELRFNISFLNDALPSRIEFTSLTFNSRYTKSNKSQPNMKLICLIS